MSSFFLEGESFFVLEKLKSLCLNKKISFNPGEIKTNFSLIKNYDYYVYFEPTKEEILNIKIKNFIICFLDKNVDLRLDYIKKIKSNSEYINFEPIPTTDFESLKKIFPKIPKCNFLPNKICNLKYKGQKQNYEWFDLSLINDLYSFNEEEVYKLCSKNFFDIWVYMEGLFNGDKDCLSQINFIDHTNFENYYNRIRESLKDYLEVIETNSNSFYDLKSKKNNSSIINEWRFIKVNDNLKKLKINPIIVMNYFENCLKNVRQGSNPKYELIKLFFRINNV